MKLTEEQIIKIVEDKKIADCSDDERSQVFAFMFGDEYLASNEKGAIKEYSE